jgi:ribosomal protein S18 acetylase RimI-like enzyme
MSDDAYWKLPFIWHRGLALPDASARLRLRAADAAWLCAAVAQVRASSFDRADGTAVRALGADGAARRLLAGAADGFRHHAHWWQRAETADGTAVGFVLPSLFERAAGQESDEGTVYYVGVLPPHRGHGYIRDLLDQATRTLASAGAHLILCDTDVQNQPMIQAFRATGYLEQPAWQRPLH